MTINTASGDGQEHDKVFPAAVGQAWQFVLGNVQSRDWNDDQYRSSFERSVFAFIARPTSATRGPWRSRQDRRDRFVVPLEAELLSMTAIPRRRTGYLHQGTRTAQTARGIAPLPGAATRSAR